MKQNMDNRFFEDKNMKEHLPLSLKKQPSGNFNREVLSRMQLENSKVEKPLIHLKLPLLLMGCLGAILIAQIIIDINEWLHISERIIAMNELIPQLITGLNYWYVASASIFLFLIQLFFLFESRTGKSQTIPG